MRNGIEIAGKTEANLSIDSLAQSDLGNYQVKVTNVKALQLVKVLQLLLLTGVILNGLYTQQQYDAALISGFNLGVQSVGGPSDSSGVPRTPAATSSLMFIIVLI